MAVPILVPAPAADEPPRALRRQVIYVQGYDPRGLAEYFRLFRNEYAKSCALHGFDGKATRPHDVPDNRFVSRWTCSTAGDGWRVETQYDFLRWEDIIQRDFARPIWWKIAGSVVVSLRTAANGVFMRLARAHWRFGLFILYPLVLLLGFALVSMLLGALAADAAMMLAPGPLAWLAGLAVAAASFAVILRTTESQTYLLYLCDDIVSTFQFMRGRRPDWNERLDVFAAHVVETARTSDADELIVVGHSSGSFLAVDVLARALELDPELGRRGPRVALLTIGANLPIVGFNPQAQWFRDRLAHLATEPSIDWVDYQSRHDIMNFWPFDPIEGHGIALDRPRHNPTVIAISFRDLWRPEGFTRRRWHFFRAHFQFLMANERPAAPYDYYLICCGPTDLATRAANPREAIAAAAVRATG